MGVWVWCRAGGRGVGCMGGVYGCSMTVSSMSKYSLRWDRPLNSINRCTIPYLKALTILRSTSLDLAIIPGFTGLGNNPHNSKTVTITLHKPNAGKGAG